jgi:hypothetical protein
MNFRSLAILATVATAVLVIADTLLFQTLDPQVRPIYNGSLRTTLLLLVALGAALAANRFGWLREYMGRAWTAFCVAYTLLAMAEIVRRVLMGSNGFFAQLCVILGNVAIVIGTFMIARAFTRAGLDFEASRSKTIIATAISLLLALALCHDSILFNFQAMIAGEATAGAMVSPLADVITFALVAPLFLTAFALRGGQQFWIFAFLTTGTIGWMLNQGWDIVGPAIGFTSDPSIRTGRIAGFVIACVFIAAAAFTQWLAARRTTQGAASV